jgi:hypothetical protein
MNALGGFMAGSIVAKLLLDKTGWNQSIKSVRKDMTDAEKTAYKIGAGIGQVARSLVGLAVAGAGAIGAMVKMTANAGEAIYDMSQRTGIAAETLSGFKLAADKSGASLQGLAVGLRFLGKSMVGNADLFKAMGIAVRDTAGNMRPMKDVMIEVADRFANMEDGAEKTALAIQLFGRSGTELIPMLNLGAEGLRKETELAEKLGIVFDTKAAAAADRFNDSLVDLKGALAGMRNTIGNALIPVFTQLSEGVRDSMIYIRERIAEFVETGQLQRWAVDAARVFIGAFKLMARSVEGLMLLLPSLKAALFAAAEGFYKFISAIFKALVAVPMISAETRIALQVAAADLEKFAAVYGNAADANIEKASDIVEGFEVLFKTLDILSTSFGKVTDSAKKTTAPLGDIVRIVETALPPAKEFDAALGQWSTTLTESVLPATNKVHDGLVRLNLELMNRSPWDMWVMKATEAVQKVQMAYQLFSTAVTAVVNQAQTNASIAIDNEYKKRVNMINKSLMSEEEKQKAMAALEAEYQIKRTEAQRKGAGATKAIALMGAIVNTAEAVTKALTVGPFIGPILAAMIAALGAIQIALIAKQPIPLAEGAAFEKPTHITNALVGEAGPEYLLPERKLVDIVRDAMMPPAFFGAPRLAGAGAGSGAGATVTLNMNGPLISTTGTSRRDLEAAGEDLVVILDRQLRRVGRRL